ncbi:MAG: metallophosphoesterase [Oscillospiraceae bacterium]|nr:metallophosphoesterase [Oscillospiraceae bacterium]
MKLKVSGYTDADKKRMYIFFGLICLAFGIFFVLSAISFPLVTVNYTVTTEKTDKPFRVVQISDLHDCYYGKDMKELTDAIDKAHPDLIVLTGDIYDDKLPNNNTSALMEYIGKRYTCIYVAGNHEFYDVERWRKNKPIAESYNIIVAEGENFTFGDITVCAAAKRLEGIDDWEEAVKRCAESADKNSFVLLLSHYPHMIDFYRSFDTFDLILSGHAHGGQWRLPWSQNGLYAPDQGFFPKLSGGRFDYEDTTLIVSRGLSRTKSKVPRIFNNPELVVIDILPA